MMMYRLFFKDGSFGAWESDFESVQESARFFGARIDYKYFEKI